MYTYESGKRSTDSTDRAHDHLAAMAASTCSPEDIAAALRVLEAMTDEDHLRPLAAQMTRDPYGNPIMDTPEQKLTQGTWSDAHNLSMRLGDVTNALRHAADTAP